MPEGVPSLGLTPKPLAEKSPGEKGSKETQAMKKNDKNLTLSRETLKSLQEHSAVNGGTATTGPFQLGPDTEPVQTWYNTCAVSEACPTALHICTC